MKENRRSLPTAHPTHRGLPILKLLNSKEQAVPTGRMRYSVPAWVRNINSVFPAEMKRPAIASMAIILTSRALSAILISSGIRFVPILLPRFLRRFSVRFNFGGTRRENHNTSGTGARGGAFGQALAWAPTTPVYDDLGNYITQDPTSSIFQNPVALAYETDNRDDRTNINALLGARYRILRDLTFDVQVGIDYTNSQYKAFSGPAVTNNYPGASRSSSENILLQNTNNLTYKKLFNNVHSLEVTGVLETQKFTGTGFNVRVNGLIYPDQSYDNLAPLLHRR